MFVNGIVRSSRNARSARNASADECRREVKKLVLKCFQAEQAEKIARWESSLALLEASTSATRDCNEAARRRSEVESHKRQFEHEMALMRLAHNQTASQVAADIVPYMIIAQTMTATDALLGRDTSS
jgi:hypothetical protein